MAKCKKDPICAKHHHWHSRKGTVFSDRSGGRTGTAILIGVGSPYIWIGDGTECLAFIEGRENLRALANAILSELKPKRRKAGR